MFYSVFYKCSTLFYNVHQHSVLQRTEFQQQCLLKFCPPTHLGLLHLDHLGLECCCKCINESEMIKAVDWPGPSRGMKTSVYNILFVYLSIRSHWRLRWCINKDLLWKLTAAFSYVDHQNTWMLCGFNLCFLNLKGILSIHSLPYVWDGVAEAVI